MTYTDTLRAKIATYDIALENASAAGNEALEQLSSFDNADTFERFADSDFFAMFKILSCRFNVTKRDVLDLQRALESAKNELELLEAYL